MMLEFKIPYARLSDIPREEYKNLHRAYWRFIAENHCNYKPYIVNCDGRILDVLVKCFACEYAYQYNLYTTMTYRCIACPIKKWRQNLDNYDLDYICEDLEYGDWCRAQENHDQEVMNQAALEISNLEWEDI